MDRVASSCVSLLTQRRGYSVAAAMVKGAGRRTDEKKVAAVAAKRAMGKKDVNMAAAAAEEKTAWVPDPVTGYYRPAGSAKEVDAAELRAKLLAQPAVN
ncbi:protein SENESCENCE-ASSOCIATED GENE 21, mitochondrial-like [Phragmites australis]|uniref:protein SENESCENCE-ASSOCIATED GENE 21, mitochondrial-like n=1 Tax=Phragmites australis TaxID=29695 RepID=UPI002D78524D|nr:protein SENESCENCE-ASSOCIATED GENE 21, mitochondrial-like [Phragmites australis]